jgi:hypothetical protein
MKTFIVIAVTIISIYGMTMQAQSLKSFTYREQGAFSISYPSDWEVIENLNSKVKVVILAPVVSGTNFRTNVNVTSLINTTESLEKLFQIEQNIINNNRQIFGNYRLVKKEDVTVNNVRGIQITATWKASGIDIVGFQYMLKKNDDTLYRITFTINLAEEERILRAFDNIIESFKAL